MIGDGALQLAGPLVERNTDADRAALAAVFAALRTPQRVRALQILMWHGPMSTVELKRAIGTTNLNHVEDLLGAGLATRRMDRGHWVWDADPDAIDEVRHLLKWVGRDPLRGEKGE